MLRASVVEDRNEQFWPRPNEFVLERFLDKEGQELQGAKTPSRPSNWVRAKCVGQELAMTELRVTLALMIQDIDIVPRYIQPVDLEGLAEWRNTMAEDYSRTRSTVCP